MVMNGANMFNTFAEMRFFYLPVSTINYNREPFTYICEWNRQSPSFSSQAQYSRSWWWPQCHWALC